MIIGLDSIELETGKWKTFVLNVPELKTVAAKA